MVFQEISMLFCSFQCFADSVRAEWFEYGIEVQVFRIGPVSTSLAERSLMTKENQVTQLIMCTSQLQFLS